jgi:hypothetical protein
MEKHVSSALTHAMFCFLVSGGFLFFGFWYPLFLVKRYGEDDFRAGGAVDLALVISLVYGVRAIRSLLRLAEHRSYGPATIRSGR